MHRRISLPPLRSCLILAVSSAVLAFGLYHIHAVSGVTEGGILGLSLLLEHWFSVSPAVTNTVVSALCYGIGWRLLGRQFIVNSAIAVGSFSLSYAVIEQFPPLWPRLADHPLAAALIGAAFVGITTGFAVRENAAICGDDALAMSFAHQTGRSVTWLYLFSDATVLLLSLTYIPWRRIAFSLLTVILSGQLIGIVTKIPRRNGAAANAVHQDGR